MKNWIEHIEDYLDGQLTTADKKAMEQAMAADENLRAEVALAKLMQEAIEKTGEIELRKYLQNNTLPHKASKPWIKYLAGAASIAAMLICGIFIYKAYAPKDMETPEKDYFGFNDSSQNNENTIDLENDQTIAAIDKNKIEKTKKDSTVETEIVNGDLEFEPGMESDVQVVENGKFLLAQTNMVPIVIGYAEPTAKEKDLTKAEGAAAQGNYDYKARTTAKKLPVQDTTLKKPKTPAPEKVLPNYNWNVRFYENSNLDVNISNKVIDKATVDLEVENLDPNNSILLQYKSNYYLKSGNDYYLLNLNQAGGQNQKVTDPTLLKALNKTAN